MWYTSGISLVYIFNLEEKAGKKEEEERTG